MGEASLYRLPLFWLEDGLNRNVSHEKSETFVSLSKKHNSIHWTPQELSILWSNYDLPAEELAQSLPGRTAAAIRVARHRYGRYRKSLSDLSGLCIVCDERPIWDDSQSAKHMKLCKGCYLRELRERELDEKAANARRQREYKKAKKRRRRQ